MKRVLITGANSYVGTNVEKWLMKEPDKFYVETLDMKDPNWKQFDFSGFDVVFHVAGIVHIKETKKNKSLYFEINSDLAVETAKTAKNAKVKQFIFMSSMSVFGKNKGCINKQTSITPISAYGKSKYLAENAIKKISDDSFKVAIVRPPMIYGANCAGNYRKLRKFIKMTPIFPYIKNKRSFLFINNLCYFIKELIDKEADGYFHPYNKDNVSTTQLVHEIIKYLEKRVYLSKSFAIVLKFIPFNFVKKITNDLYYDIKKDQIEYVKFDTSISLTEEYWQ